MKIKICQIIIIVVVAVIAGSCGNNSKYAADSGVHTHNETLQLTAYGAEFEFFAEASPFVAGETGDILAHFSHLKDFKPLTEGSITASLITGADSIGQIQEHPTRPGIYRFSLLPARAGTGRLMFDIETHDGKSQITVPNITVYGSEHEAHEAAAASAVTVSSGITFTKEQSWKVDFATAEVRREPFGQIIRTTAQIQPSQGDERIVAAQTGGIVSFVAGTTEGKAVSAGQSLLSIDGSSTEDHNLAVRYAEAESEYSRAKTEYNRKAELAKDNIVSQSDLLKARTELANAEAGYSNLKRIYSAGEQSVRSPIGGFITRVLVQNGQHVEAGQPVLVVSQNRELLVKAELQPKYFDLLDGITSANIRLPNSNRTLTLEELDGRVLSYGKSTDLNSPFIPVTFQVKNKAGLLPGSFVEIFIKTQTSAQVLTVPSEAITEEMGNYFVFVQRTPELFEKRPVKTGVTDGIRTEITEGVSAGERVVGKGATLVKLAQSSATLDPHAGHVH